MYHFHFCLLACSFSACCLSLPRHALVSPAGTCRFASCCLGLLQAAKTACHASGHCRSRLQASCFCIVPCAQAAATGCMSLEQTAQDSQEKELAGWRAPYAHIRNRPSMSQGHVQACKSVCLHRVPTVYVQQFVRCGSCHGRAKAANARTKYCNTCRAALPPEMPPSSCRPA